MNKNPFRFICGLVIAVTVGGTVGYSILKADRANTVQQTPAPVAPEPDLKLQVEQLKKDLQVQKDEAAKLKQKQDEIDAKIEKMRRQQAAKIAFEDNLKCLADNIYYEAAFEPEEGKIAVAQVTINRLNDPDYPKTVCGVVYERHRTKANKISAAFSWTLTPFRPKGPKSKRIYEQVLEIAKAVLTKKEKSDIIGDDVKFYHASYIHAPVWTQEHEQVAEIGNHIFYR
jgi:spore germination cell wall hydrolase CwlJ-like protein